MFFFFFFFQAEDGIRDRDVTGVQTCALPIYITLFKRLQAMIQGNQFGGTYDTEIKGVKKQQRIRSEERRVGKECRSRGSPYH